MAGTSTMEIGLATVADVPPLAALLEILFAQEAEFVPDRPRQERGLREIIANPATGQILVLREGGAIRGMVSLLYLVSTALGGRVALLEDMVVAPERRGRGAGSMLLGAAIAHARNAGCRRITLLTDGANTAAQRFYARHGFAPSAMMPMRLFVDARQD